ncbi:hypothetical protein CDL15_Pgr007472 [Punica granatum]|uniref:Uncharacterized protein n=1 Tax=Punica granatum TaxID=22663 RepID=A0A218X938_PUNGR|nr:hypothetical protein CDL15_Pgr007472 [Punica granatum]
MCEFEQPTPTHLLSSLRQGGLVHLQYRSNEEFVESLSFNRPLLSSEGIEPADPDFLPLPSPTLYISARRCRCLVSQLNLRNNSISGAVPALVGLLHLEDVSLSRNGFSGSIPSEYAELPTLTKLEL